MHYVSLYRVSQKGRIILKYLIVDRAIENIKWKIIFFSDNTQITFLKKNFLFSILFYGIYNIYK